MTAPLEQHQRLGVAAAFKIAKRRLWDGHPMSQGEHFICFALTLSGHRSNLRAQRIIMDRLNGSVGSQMTVSGYLRYGLRIPNFLLTDKNIQTFRHLWLDSLIKEFSA